LALGSSGRGDDEALRWGEGVGNKGRGSRGNGGESGVVPGKAEGNQPNWYQEMWRVMQLSKGWNGIRKRTKCKG
jgi:hypothetical protein